MSANVPHQVATNIGSLLVWQVEVLFFVTFINIMNDQHNEKHSA